jgi:hypothetical protein
VFMWGWGAAYHNHCSIFRLAVEMASRPNCTIKTCKQEIMSLHTEFFLKKAHCAFVLRSVICTFFVTKIKRVWLVLMPKKNTHLSQLLSMDLACIARLIQRRKILHAVKTYTKVFLTITMNHNKSIFMTAIIK